MVTHLTFWHFCENVQLRHFLCGGRYKQKIKYAAAFGDDSSWLSHVLRIGGHNVSTLNFPLNSFPGNRVNSVLWKWIQLVEFGQWYLQKEVKLHKSNTGSLKNINTKHVCGHTKHYTTVVYDKTWNAVVLEKASFSLQSDGFACNKLIIFMARLAVITVKGWESHALPWVSIFIGQSSRNVSTGETPGRAGVKANAQIRLALIRQIWLTRRQLNLAHEGPRRLPAPILRHAAARGEQNHHSRRHVDHCRWRVWKGLQLCEIHLRRKKSI